VTLTDKIVDSPEGLFPGGWCNDSSVPVGASNIYAYSIPMTFKDLTMAI
jgi:hypothetical protein